MSKKTGTGRNDLCPCGSGKKYKKCCGARISTQKGPKTVPPISKPPPFYLDMGAIERERRRAMRLMEFR